MGRVVLGFLKLRGIEFDALSVLVKKKGKRLPNKYPFSFLK